jgi:hypothetical protein
MAPGVDFALLPREEEVLLSSRGHDVQVTILEAESGVKSARAWPWDVTDTFLFFKNYLELHKMAKTYIKIILSA